MGLKQYNSEFPKVYSMTLKETINTRVQNRPQSYYLYAKQIIDYVFAVFGLIFCSIIIFAFAAAVKLESRGSAFYLQERVGLNGKRFKIIKLRSMYENAEITGAQWAAENDSRVTKVGSFIRRTRIDELPQLINVIKGDMSLVGPRPERPEFTVQFNEETPGFVNRLAVKPGLTGLAQVNGGYYLGPKEKLVYDLAYIKKINFFIDMKILLKTIVIVLTGHGAR